MLKDVVSEKRLSTGKTQSSSENNKLFLVKDSFISKNLSSKNRSTRPQTSTSKSFKSLNQSTEQFHSVNLLFSRPESSVLTKKNEGTNKIDNNSGLKSNKIQSAKFFSKQFDLEKFLEKNPQYQHLMEKEISKEILNY